MEEARPYAPGIRQARADSPFPDGAIVAAARQETHLTVIARRLVELHDRLATSTARMMQVNDRTFGATPAAASNSKEGSHPVAAVDEIHVLLDRLNQTATWLDSEVERIERL